MQTGTYISGMGHFALIGWAMLAGVFNSDNTPPPTDTANVTILSGEEFAALTDLSVTTPPVIEAAQPTAPVEPETPTAPTVPTPDTAPEAVEQPTPTPPAQPDTAPDASQIEPLPQADVMPETPDAIEPPDLPAGTSFVATPTTSPRPKPATRIAPQQAAQPAPEADLADVVQDAVVPDETLQAREAEEAQEQTAPEEANTITIPEEANPGGSQQATFAPTGSPRPPSRPNRPRPAATRTEPTDTSIGDAVNDVVAAAAAAETAPVPQGPPMTSGEKDALRVAVQQCWNVGSLSSEALRITVTVMVDMNQDGKPDTGSIRMISADGGSQAAARQAFEAARRAVIRCGAKGYDLPADKYGQWREIEMVFNPEKMRDR